MPTAVEAASAMETASAVKVATAMKAASTMKATTTAAESTYRPAPTERPKAGTAVKAGASIEPVEPWPGADKHSAGEPLRTVVAIGRAPVWVIRVVAVGAHRSRPVVSRTDPYAYENSLCACVGCRNHDSAKYRQYR